MDTHTTVWRRLGNMLGGLRNGTNGGNGAHKGDHVASGLLRWTRSLTQSSGRRASLERMAVLMDALQEHFHRQDERSEQFAGSLDRVAGTLQQLADTQRRQGECVETITKQVDAAGRHTAALSETLNRMPLALQSQAEAMRAVVAELQKGRELDGQVLESLNRVGVAADTLRSSGQAQVETLERLSRTQRDQVHALTGLMRDQGRRFLWIIGIITVLAIGALGGLFAVLLTILKSG